VKAFVPWSPGKDSAFALHDARHATASSSPTSFHTHLAHDILTR
jgi:hypothetical protein